MRILYDGEIYRYQTRGGISRYFSNLICRLPDAYRPTVTSCRTLTENKPSHRNLRVQTYRHFRPARLSRKAETQYFRLLGALNTYDVAHPTYYTTLAQENLGRSRCPVVLTVWDMTHEAFPEQMDRGGDFVEKKRRAILEAQALICISESTKRDLLTRYPVPEERITVIPLASDLDPGLSYGPESVPARPYFLYVGGRTSAYKNFDGLLRAFALLASVRAEVGLCVVGLPFSAEEERLIADLKLADRIDHYQATDRHLAKLYRCSLAFVYPSLYEGFGIPLLEAMACGTPVVAADSSCFPEVVGGAGLLFDPRSPDELAQILLGLTAGTVDRDALIAKGQERCTAFSWDTAARRTVDVYRSVAKKA